MSCDTRYKTYDTRYMMPQSAAYMRLCSARRAPPPAPLPITYTSLRRGSCGWSSLPTHHLHKPASWRLVGGTPDTDGQRCVAAAAAAAQDLRSS